MKWVAALPTLAGFAAQDMAAKALKSTRYSARENIYTRIGVTPIINARGTWTYMSGSLENVVLTPHPIDNLWNFLDGRSTHVVISGDGAR